MRILFLSDAVHEELPGGSRVVARELSRRLVARGHDVTFLVARHRAGTADDESVDGARIVRYDGAGQGQAYIAAGARAAAKLWSERPFDIVHTHFAYGATGPLRSIPSATPHVRTFHGPWDEEGWIEDRSGVKAETRPFRRAVMGLRSRVVRAVRRRIERDNLQRSRYIIVLSRDMAGRAASYGVPESRIRRIPGGVDTSRFRPATSKSSVRALLGLPAQRRILISVRRLAPRMGLDNLITAMPGIAKRQPDVLLLIGGSGPENERLTDLISNLKMEHHVRMLGFIADADLASFYQAADLFVLPTVALEGFGLVTVEALSTGLPVIGTPVGATPEILADIESGLITAGVTPGDLTESICRFMESPVPEQLTPDRLHDYVCRRFSWDKHVQAVECLYDEADGSR